MTTQKIRYALLIGKNNSEVIIVRSCSDVKCENLHYFTRVDDEFAGSTIVRALNNG